MWTKDERDNKLGKTHELSIVDMSDSFGPVTNGSVNRTTEKSLGLPRGISTALPIK